MSQIFQFSFPTEKFFDFLQKYCIENKNQFVFSKSAFKKAKLDDAIQPFCEDLKKFRGVLGKVGEHFGGFKEILRKFKEI